MIKLFVGLFFTLTLWASPLSHIVVLGDPHLPGQNLPQKEQALEQINQWNDVKMVVPIGDLCFHTGTQEEYNAVKIFFEKLYKPLYPITGNHDFIYADELDDNKKLKHAPLEVQEAKLKRFQTLFELPKLYYSLKHEGYLLIFLSADNPRHLSELSQEQLDWFKQELQQNAKVPTIVFFHAPLDQTLESYKHWVNTPNFIAQPKEVIHEIITQNPQLFLWVSGHTHTSAKEPSFASKINHYLHVTNIHNSDMKKETIWTNSLFLYADHVTIKTYDHTQKTWIDSLERTIFVPKF